MSDLKVNNSVEKLISKQGKKIKDFQNEVNIHDKLTLQNLLFEKPEQSPPIAVIDEEITPGEN